MNDLEPENSDGKNCPWNEDLIFLAMTEHLRRHILVCLATGPKYGKDIHSIVGKSFPNTVKHLIALCEAEIVIKKENPSDRRKPLYALNPAIPPVVTGTELMLDFRSISFRLPLDMKPLPPPPPRKRPSMLLPRGAL